jgi:hypothetical protein
MTVLLTTIPKSGTHLAQHVFALGWFFASHYADVPAITKILLTHPPVTGHIVPHPKVLKTIRESGRTVIFLHREPKDTIVSMAHHAMELGDIWSPFTPWGDHAVDRSDPLLWLIENIKPWHDYLMDWTEYADFVITYEQLINMPDDNIFKVSDFLGLDRRGVLRRSKDRVKRFRTGKSGNWKDEFEPRHMEAYERIWES